MTKIVATITLTAANVANITASMEAAVRDCGTVPALTAILADTRRLAAAVRLPVASAVLANAPLATLAAVDHNMSLGIALDLGTRAAASADSRSEAIAALTALDSRFVLLDRLWRGVKADIETAAEHTQELTNAARRDSALAAEAAAARKGLVEMHEAEAECRRQRADRLGVLTAAVEKIRDYWHPASSGELYRRAVEAEIEAEEAAAVVDSPVAAAEAEIKAEIAAGAWGLTETKDRCAYWLARARKCTSCE